ncbi:MAG: hypothetical protein H0X62_04160, partial [Bacteroidetes bacterium]|nr:hypothetical protein [Bacteroidota bacterium]
MYAKIRNIGCTSVTLEPHMIALQYQTFGMSTNQMGTIPKNRPIGDLTIPPGEERVVEFKWTKPPKENGKEITACLVVSIAPTNDPIGVWNALASNNIAEKNVLISEKRSKANFESAIYYGEVHVGNYEDNHKDLDIKIFENSVKNPDDFVKSGHFYLDLGETIFEKWKQTGFSGSGFEFVPLSHSVGGEVHFHEDQIVESPYLIKITDTVAILENLNFTPHDTTTIKVYIAFSNQNNNKYYEIDIVQKEHGQEAYLNGVGYDIFAPECFIPDAGPDQYVGLDCNIMLTANLELGDNVEIIWRNSNTGEFIADNATQVELIPNGTT